MDANTNCLPPDNIHQNEELRMKKIKVVWHVKIPPELMERIRVYCKATGRSQSDFAQTAVERELLKREEYANA